MRPSPLAAALLAAALLAACEATRVGTAASFEEAVDTYAAADEKKALAVAADERGRRRWGAQYGSVTQDRANRDAMEECQASARRHALEAQCYLFAIGNREARSTLEGCRAGRVNPKRCALQRQYGTRIGLP